MIGKEKGFAFEEAQLLSPVPFPASCRNAFMFTEEDKFKYTDFYFDNHHSIQGAGPIICMPDFLHQLYFTPGVAIVISKPGRNIIVEEADEYIGGMMIVNSFYSGNMQSENIPAASIHTKGKNFAIATGPYFITTDELEEFEIISEENKVEKTWNFNITCNINNEPVSDYNKKDISISFARLIEQASYGATLFPGDVICINLFNNQDSIQLKEGDVIETEIKDLGILINTIEQEESEFSLLEK